MIPHYIVNCKLCEAKNKYTAWHPLWQTKQICWDCRDRMYARHKKWMDKLLNKQQELRRGRAENPINPFQAEEPQ